MKMRGIKNFIVSSSNLEQSIENEKDIGVFGAAVKTNY